MVASKLPVETRPDLSAVYLSGLLHNLGELVLAYAFPAECDEVYRMRYQDPSQDIPELESAIVGCTRQQAAEWLGLRWHLPDFVVRTASRHTDTEYSGSDAEIVLLIGTVARWLSNGVDEQASLAGSPAFCDRFKIDSHLLAKVSEKYFAQYEEIKLLAKRLV